MPPAIERISQWYNFDLLEWCYSLFLHHGSIENVKTTAQGIVECYCKVDLLLAMLGQSDLRTLPRGLP